MTPNPCDPGVTDPRAMASFQVRFKAAKEEASLPIPAHDTNGDEARYADKCATYTKGLQQDRPGVVNPAAYASFQKALHSGDPKDFAKIHVGGTQTLNGPQGAYAFTLVGTDAQQFGSDPSAANQEPAPIVPAPPALASEAYGTELTELFWCSLLRDTAFTDYPASPTAAAAAAELSAMPAYAGPRDGAGQVTPRLLFRGGHPGETVGPYVSQLMLRPTTLGAQAISQQFTTYLPGIDYMTDLTTWQAVQNGVVTGLVNQKDPAPRHLHDGRGMAAFTHVDELFQAYLTAYLVLKTLGTPLNPENPYLGSKTQNGFGTFGGPDIASTLSEVAKIALNAVWYQKWLVHLRHRPEAGGGIAELTRLNGGGSPLDGGLNANVLNSSALAQSFSRYGNYLLSQPFPEGSPYHPAYPTGHGTVAGACITVLKFFFDGGFVIPDPKVPASDGASLLPYAYTGDDGGLMTVNGELNKLAHNVTFAHGLHGGIHWRSDSDSSIVLGEAVAISFLRDKARTYNEKFKIHLARVDGGTAVIEN